MSNPYFSIIIPCRSIGDFLKESIPHLKKLEFKNFEVLIVLDKLEKFDFGGDKRFKILESGPVGPGTKRNLGSKHATGEILAFLDDDAYPTSRWLDQAFKVLSKFDTYALGAPAVTPLVASFLERMSGKVLESVFTSAGTMYRHIPMKRRYIDDYPTVNLFVNRKLFLELGGFNEDFWPGEDTKLCLDMVKHNKKGFLYDPSPVVFHHRRELFFPHLKQISRYAKHRGQFAKIFPETSRRFAYFVPSLFVLGLFIGPALASVFVFIWPVYILSLWIYVIVLLIEGIRLNKKDLSIKTVLYFMQGVFLTHLVYGLNFIVGFIKKPQLKLRSVDVKTGNYLGG